MSDTTSEPTKVGSRNLLATLEIDTRLLGMIGAFVAIALVFNFWTDGRFLTPRNIFNLTIQTVSVGIMAAGMVFVIVTRHIDLSVGALLATVSALMAMTQTQVLPNDFGFGLNNPATVFVTILIGLVAGTLIGAFHGYLIGFLTIPAFIVTLGGLFVWRNVAWFQTRGQTIGPLDERFQSLGGIGGTLGETGSLIFGLLAIAAALFGLFTARRRKVQHEFPVKPLWAEITLGAIISGAILGFVLILNNYEKPVRVIQREFAARGETMPEGYSEAYGIPYSVLILILVAIVMTMVATKTRLGRYIFAAGGNPEATSLAGVDIRWLTVKVFAIMGALCAISAVVASARLTFHTNDIGTLDELRVIAAAVIGGTALSGGLGTIHGAILGALIMQSLQSGMAMVGVDAPFQNIVVGIVLVLAVFVDILYRKRTGIK
ncbi:MAG TPA: sugar ABC transporter permease [Rhodobacteraceae bacterium]|nr:sugar ABC transporter permease [Paracoccaceae bacterium]